MGFLSRLAARADIIVIIISFVMLQFKAILFQLQNSFIMLLNYLSQSNKKCTNKLNTNFNKIGSSKICIFNTRSRIKSTNVTLNSVYYSEITIVVSSLSRFHHGFSNTVVFREVFFVISYLPFTYRNK